MYYIVIITSKDWYTFYEGYEIVKAKNSAEAAKMAEVKFMEKQRHGETTFPSYISIEDIIETGNRKPKGV